MRTLAKNHQNGEQKLTLSEEQYKMMDKRRKAHLKSESKSFTWEQVKQNARNTN